MKPRPGYEGLEIEVFRWYDLGMEMNVTKALEIVGAPYAEPDGFIAIESVRGAEWIKNITAFSRADLSEPVLIVTIGGTRLLVDGRHRAKKALVHQVPRLPCYTLTEKETKKCFEGKLQQVKLRNLRDFLRRVEIKVDMYYPEIRHAEKRPLHTEIIRRQ